MIDIPEEEVFSQVRIDEDEDEDRSIGRSEKQEDGDDEGDRPTNPSQGALMDFAIE